VTTSDQVVLLFGGRQLPRPLRGLTSVVVDGSDEVDSAVGQCRRLIVVGSDADLAVVLGRLLRAQGLGFVVTEPVAVPLAPAGALELLAGTAQHAKDSKLLTDSEQR